MDLDMAANGGISIFDIDRAGDVYWTCRPSACAVASTRIPLFICPDDMPYTRTPVAGTLYFQGNDTIGGVSFAAWYYPQGVGYPPGRANYLGVAGFCGFMPPSKKTDPARHLLEPLEDRFSRHHRWRQQDADVR